MKISIQRMFLVTLLTTLALAGVVGCAQIRKLTYPKDFVYLEKKEVESLMQNMGGGLARLNRLVAEALPNDTAKQQQIVAELSSIERIATRLSGGHKQTNQIVIGDHIQAFISDLSTAKMHAKNTPPDYSKAKKIDNSCRSCHQFR